MNRGLAKIRALYRDPRTHELLRWCLPALLAGLVLRAVLMAQMPHAFFHDDTPDLLSTPDRFFNEGRLSLHEKKTFLAPFFITAHGVLPAPALITIPLTQHLLGLALIVFVGVLCRLWFRRWKWFIVPLTVLFAVNPYILWYEHTLMAEWLYLFCVVLLAVAGTLYARRQSITRLACLCAALVLAAGARPEAKLLFGFSLLIIPLVHWRDWRVLGQRLALLLALGLATHLVTRTKQGGLLLYTSIARFTPAELQSAPGFEPYIAPVRAELRRRWEEKRSFSRARDRRAVAAAVRQYLVDAGREKESTEKLCHRLASETLRRSSRQLPGWLLVKFQRTAAEEPSGWFDDKWLFEEQREAWLSDFPRVQRVAPLLFRCSITDPGELHTFIDQHYGRLDWFNAWQRRWTRAVTAWHVAKEPPFVGQGSIPIYMLFAGVGLSAAAFARSPLRPFHIAWGISLLGLFTVVILTANVQARLRFVFEPFWFLYVALLADVLWSLLKAPPTISSADQSDPRPVR